MTTKTTEPFQNSLTLTMTDEMVARYAAVSNDQNPIHLSKAAAKEAGFTEKVTHGMLTMALSTKLISPMLGKTWMVEQLKTKFIAPLYVNDPIIITAKVQHEANDEIRLKLAGQNERGEAVIRGDVLLRRRV